MSQGYPLLSADSHLEVAPERWRDRVPKKFRERAPRTVKLPDGGDALMIEGSPLQEVMFADLRAGLDPSEWQPYGLQRDKVAGTASPEQRLREQDQDGMAAEVLFPNMVAGPSLWRNIADDQVYNTMVRAYNDWLAEEYCSVDPDRLIGLGVIPWSSLDAAMAELEHCQKLGLKGVNVGTFPSGNRYPSLEDDLFWRTTIDMRMPVAVHFALNLDLAFAFGSGGKRGSQPNFIYPKQPPEVRSRIRLDLVEWCSQYGLKPAVGMAQMVLSGVFDRLPELKVFFAETRLGWIPSWLESADAHYGLHMGWVRRLLDFQPLERGNFSDYVREHLYFSVQYEKLAVQQRHMVGVDHIMFATDFPHIESEWPQSREVIAPIYQDVPKQERDQIYALNAIDFFALDPAIVAHQTGN